MRFCQGRALIVPRRAVGNHRIDTKCERDRLKLVLRGKRFGGSISEIAEISSMTSGESDDIRQIDKSPAHGSRKLKELRDRIEEPEHLEHDLLSVKVRILDGRAETKKGR